MFYYFLLISSFQRIDFAIYIIYYFSMKKNVWLSAGKAGYDRHCDGNDAEGACHSLLNINGNMIIFSQNCGR